MGRKGSPRHSGPRTGATSLQPIDKVPTLRYGPDNNFLRFKEALSTAAVEKYGALRKLIELGGAWKKQPPDPAKYNLSEDPHGVNLDAYRQDCKDYRKMLTKHSENEPKLYATIYGKLSVESLDEVKRHPNFADFNRNKDPLEFWLAITEVPTQSKIQGLVKKVARDTYNATAQGAYETIIIYKQRFDAAWEAYRDMENPEMDETDFALDFQHGLDDTRYADFKVSLLNDIDQGAIEVPSTVNKMYLLASRHLVVTKRPGGSSARASFTKANRQTVKREERHHGRRKDPRLSEPRGTAASTREHRAEATAIPKARTHQPIGRT
jgi:hypothetical protein